MKILKYILPIVMLAMLHSCSELDEVKVGDTTAPVMINHTAIVIDGTNQDVNTIFKWDRADFGYQDAADYSLFVKYQTGEPTFIGTAQGDSIIIKNSDLNKALIKAGIPTNIAVSADFYVTAAISASYPESQSNNIAVSVTAYKYVAFLYIPGSHQGWNPETAPFLTSNMPDDPFEGMVDLNALTADGFKFTLERNWTNNLGGTFAALVPNGANLVCPAGYYRMVVNAAKTQVTTNLKINTIGAIGSGVPGNWGSETKMTYNAADNTWVIASIAITNGGEFKLRINDDWGNAIGGTLDAATFGGGNIAISATSGNYKMTLHAGELPYVITLTAP